jgi:hypothetical protein
VTNVTNVTNIQRGSHGSRHGLKKGSHLNGNQATSK